MNPKWKSKIVATDPKTGEGRNGARFLYHHPELGPQYLRRLFSEMDITFSRDYRQATDWLAQKRFALYLFSQSDDTLNAKEPGTVGTDPRHRQLEGSARTGRHRRRLLTDGQARPSQRRKDSRQLAALPRGQIALQRDAENAGSTDSLRIDIPKTDVHPIMRRKDGVKYLEMWNPNWMNMKPVEELINQVMGEGKKN